MVGQIGGQQKISIGRGCEYLHTVIHEIGEFFALKSVLSLTKNSKELDFVKSRQ